MGHESLSVLSPAHRRNQNPASPSASMFRRSSTFYRDETDLSWTALIKRHRFLLLMLALLIFLCSIYLYFAITLGANSCSSLSGKEEALCQLKKGKIKRSHDHKASRRLLSDQKSMLAIFGGHEPKTEVKLVTNDIPWMEHMPLNGKHLRALCLGCKKGKLIEQVNKQAIVTMSSFDCEEERLLDRDPSKLQHSYVQRTLPFLDSSFESAIRNNCRKLVLVNDAKHFRELEPLLQDGGYFVWVSELSGDSANGSSQSADTEICGLICFKQADYTSKDGEVA